MAGLDFSQALDTSLATLNTSLQELIATTGNINSDDIILYTHTFVGGAAVATSAVTVPGVTAEDAIFVQCKTAGASVDQSTLASAVATDGVVTFTWDVLAALDPVGSVWEILAVRNPNRFLGITRAVGRGAASTDTEVPTQGLIASSVVIGMIGVINTDTDVAYNDLTSIGYQAANNARFGHVIQDTTALVGVMAFARKSFGTKMIAVSMICNYDAEDPTTGALTVAGITTSHKVFASLRTAHAGELTLAMLKSVHASAANTITVTQAEGTPVTAVLDIIAFDLS